jgi:WD40 repeat protein/mono/diheme cytochrome c family protein
MTRFAVWFFALATLCVASDFGFADDTKKDAAPGKISYSRDIRPIFHQHCLGCHQPAKAQGGYVMTDHAALLKAGEAEKAGVVPGKPGESHLLDQIRVKNGKAEMPKNRDPLSDKQIKLVEEWIKQGAADDTPPAAKAVVVDADHPPVYQSPPVVSSLAFSPDGKLLAVSGYHEVLLHKADGSALVARLVGVAERVQAVAFSPDGKLLAVAGGSPGRFGEVQIWDVAKRKLKVSAPVTFDTVYGVSWAPDGSMVAVGCGDNTVRGINPDNGKQVLQMGTHSDWVLGTVFSQDGLHLASVGRDMTVKLTEVQTERFVDNVTSITPGALKGGIMTIDRRPMKEKKMQKLPEDTPGVPPKVYDELLAAGSDGTPRLYKMHRETKRVIGDDANRIREFEKMPGRISTARFSPDGTRFAAASSLDGKGEVRVYVVGPDETDKGKGKDKAQNEDKKPLPKPVICEKITGPAYAVAWHPDGKLIASAGFDGKVWLHDPATGKLVKEFIAVPLGRNAPAVTRSPP